MNNPFLYNNIIKLNQSYTNSKKLKTYQLAQLYKIINLDYNIKSNNLFLKKLTKFIKPNNKYNIFKKIKKYKFFFLISFFNSKFNNNVLTIKLKNNVKKKNRFRFNLLLKLKLKLKRKRFFFFKTIYMNKWWFYFLKRIYPYISINYFEFKLKKLLKKICKLLTKANLKNIYKIFFKFALVNNLHIFFNKNYIILTLNYTKLLKLFIFFNLKNKFLNFFKYSYIKDWLIINYNFSFSFIRLFYKYNILSIFYINFQCLKNKLTYFSNIEIYYDLIKYQDNSKLFIAVTPQNLITTINRRYKKGLEYQKY
jgi:hypothetical protein